MAEWRSGKHDLPGVRECGWRAQGGDRQPHFCRVALAVQSVSIYRHSVERPRAWPASGRDNRASNRRIFTQPAALPYR